MKLIRFGEPRSEKPGVLVNDRRLDLSSEFRDWDTAFFSSGGLGSLGDLLRTRTPESFPEVPHSMRWGAPIARPGKIVCIGLNFHDHAREAGMEVPKEPILFLKATNTVVGPNDDLLIPRCSKKTDWEIELGVILGKEARYLGSPSEAAECIGGNCPHNGGQKHDGPVGRQTRRCAARKEEIESETHLYGYVISAGRKQQR